MGSVGNATPAPDDDTSDDKAKSPTKRLPTYRIKFTKQLEIIRVYGIKSQNGKAAHYKDVGEMVGIHANTVSLMVGFLVENGFLERNGDATLATKPVIDFALAHNWSTESAPRKLAPIIRNSWFGKILLEKLAFRSMNEDEAIADLAGEIAAEPEYKPQIGTLIEYAVATGLVRRDGSQLSLGDEATAPSPETSAPRAERIQTMPEQRDDPSPRSPASVATGFMNTEGAVQFHVSIKVS
ncbi:MAG TPA: hypothetical protein VK653_08315, partial [Xanthobacteraceae bacterium]|nr:hypothetical protein [Xanthobacteraceae bacterium]